MALPKLLLYAATAAAGYLAQVLLAPKPPKNPLDNSRTEPSERGSLLGILNGHFRIGPVIAFVGDRFGKSRDRQITYYENAWHLISMGQGRSLRRIYVGGKTIWQGNATPSSHPSGSYIATEKGNLYIYWGETGQPIGAEVATSTGISSRWPYVFYVYWKQFNLGKENVLWPQVEYEVTVTPSSTGKVSGSGFFDYTDGGYSSVPFQVRFWKTDNKGVTRSWNFLRILNSVPLASELGEGMDIHIDYGGEVVFRAEVVSVSVGTTYTTVTMNNSLPLAVFPNPYVAPYPVPIGNGWYNAITGYAISSDAFSDLGANPAHTLDQFLFQPRPLGAGFDRSLFDDSLDDVQTMSTTEEIPTTSLLRSGRSWSDGIASLMQDLGMLLRMDPTTGLYGFSILRGGGTPTSIPAEYYEASKTRETFAYSVLAAESRVFTYKDSARNFEDSTIPMTDDAQTKYGADPNVKSIALETITSFKPASRVASRRDAELSVEGTGSLDVSYKVNPLIGSLVQPEGFDSNYRVVSVSSNPDSATRTLGLMQDAYVTDADYAILPPVGLNPASRTKAMPDSIVTLMEANRYLYPDQHGYSVLRLRHNAYSQSAYIYDSSTDVSYSYVGEQLACTGGLLLENFPSTSGGFVETGPTVSLVGAEEEFDDILDLSLLAEDWRSGKQLCLIGGELFFLRNITITGTDPLTFRLEGLLRARLGTAREDHHIDDVVYIFQPSEVGLFLEQWLVPNQNLYVKSIPYNQSSVANSADVDSVSLVPYRGGGYRPLQPENLTTTYLVNAWQTGQDIPLYWDYKNAYDTAGAGIGLSDQPSYLASPEGYFKLEILNGSTVVRTITGLTGPLYSYLVSPWYTYTSANRVADFSGEPASFNARVYNVLNGLISEPEEATFTLV